MLAIRAYLVRRLLPGVRIGRLAARAAWPVAAAGASAAALRLALWGGDRDPLQAAAELLLFAVVYAGASWATERDLIRDLRQTAATPSPT